MVNVTVLPKHKGDNKMEKFEYSINKKLIDKTPINANNNRCFDNTTGTVKDLACSINEGYAFWAKCVPNKTRNKKNFISSNLLVLDFDHDYTIKEALENDFIKKYAAIIYKTPNHTEQNNRFRIIFKLEFPIKDKESYENAIRGLLKLFPQADKSCSDCSRVYYGSKNSNPQVFENIIPNSVISNLINSGKITDEDTINDIENSDFNKKSYNEEKIKKILSFIEKEPGYEVWRNIVWAVCDLVNNDDSVFALISGWSPDIKYAGKHLHSLIKNFRKRKGDKKLITYKTLLYEAQKRGYKIFSKKSDKISGHIALKELFNNGIGYISFNDTLHKFNGKYYEKMEQGYVEYMLTNFFDTYQDNKGKLPFAKPTYVNEAYIYILRKTRIEDDKINPSGINTQNGYLEMTYENKKVSFNLIPHSPDLYFTYCANFDYNPKAPSKIFDETMDKMLSRAKQKILFRVLAASFDLRGVRKVLGRGVRLLLLFGDGSNGKDTLKEWIEQLYAGQGVTAIPLQAFRSADKSREFSLSDLATSKVNWSSENAAISIDECQALKNFVTGDSMKIERKYKDPQYIKPNAIGLFNINKLPYITSKIEAIVSRYALIKFETIFSMNPKQGQVQADPRLKEDPEFVSKNILPALLNRLIEEFQNLLNEGINYEPIEQDLDSARYSCSHLYRFIEDIGVEECDIEEGISATEFLEVYHPYMVEQGAIELWPDGTFKRIVADMQYDKPIIQKTEVTQRLKTIFPDLKYGKNKNGERRIGLKFLTKPSQDVNY